MRQPVNLLSLLLAIIPVMAFSQSASEVNGTIHVDKANVQIDWNRVNFIEGMKPVVLSENNLVREVTGISVFIHKGDSLVKCSKIVDVGVNTDYFPGLWFNYMDSTGNFSSELLAFIRSTPIVPEMTAWEVTAECPNDRTVTITGK